MHSALWARAPTGYHTNGTQGICDSSEWNAKAWGCLCRVHVMCQLDLRKAKCLCGFTVCGACRELTVAVWLLCPQSMRPRKSAAEMEVVKAIACSLAYLILYSFSWGRFRKITLKMFPVLNWLFSYRFREWFLRDLHAGLSVGMFQIPQGRQREKKTLASFCISCFS